MIIGILDLQGDVEEHQLITEKTFKEMNIEGTTKLVNVLEDIKDCDGLIISGGESSTIGMHLKKTGIYEYIKTSGIPILGTCAGLVLLSEKTDQDQPLLGLINASVKRNGFGRQRMSFETDITFNNEEYHGIFIRAPYVDEISGDVEVLSKYDDKIIAVKQNQYMGIAFHPELTEDTLVHKVFLNEVLDYIA
ncbi:pyridoxal 5'-phosphate synthase glutaminase subunit PdxT [Methanosphaera sp. WGK6]|uniref:pyridoxal 5'-phosphate synthase glutaminase subunit PdxT n=1 Tax=Methanosphaera sp. WGK6 TaxID=1561964 RepID=UPI00084C35A0|nr:pyridoxal 5'-phosphate synthase glutaminase subunit PdxT [Methanosphaera sp. WGK6]OED29535.1 glutamine amidotransferase [Methanosphaera sp. WGK6]